MDSQDAKAPLSSLKYLAALGSNLPGNAASPVENLELALSLFAKSGLRITGRSRWYRSSAWPPGSGPEFVNGAVAFEADVDAASVLQHLHKIEARVGRTRKRRWEARICDIDLLASGDEIVPDRKTLEAWMYQGDAEQSMNTPDSLLLPHPRLHQLAFVLVPLAEIAAEWVHPVLHKSIADLLAALPSGIKADLVPLV